jgi:ribosomal protein S11
MQEHKRKEVVSKTSRKALNTHFTSQYLQSDIVGNSSFSFKKLVVDGPIKSIIEDNFNFSNKNLGSVSGNSYSIYVHATKRNTRLSFCKLDGSHIFSYTMGQLGHKKSKRGNAYFVKDLCLKFLQKLESYKISSYVLYVNGFGRSRRPIINFFSRSKLRYKCSYILDVTPKSHNGCRSRIRRRL